MTITVAEFCLALHRVSLRGGRDDQGSHGEDIWASLEVVERNHGAEVVELPTTLEETFMLADRLHMSATGLLRAQLTRMPDWERVLVDDWNEYRREWWGFP